MPISRAKARGFQVSAALLLMVSVSVAQRAEKRGPADMLAPLPADPQAAQQLRSLLPGPARLYESRHFLMVHSMPLRSVIELAGHLEAVYRAWVRFARQLDLPIRRPAYKLNVLVFASFDDFCAYRERHGTNDTNVLGLYDARSNVSVFFDLATYPPLRDLRNRRAEKLRADPDAARAELARFRQATEVLYAKVIRHEGAHHVQFATGAFCSQAGSPAWVVEGLAQLFEVPASGRSAAASSANPHRLSELRSTCKQPADLLTGLRRVVADDEQLQDRDYALAWALVNYLSARRPQAFAAYLRVLADCTCSSSLLQRKRQPQFEEHFGPVDEAFAADLWDYLQSMR